MDASFADVSGTKRGVARAPSDVRMDLDHQTYLKMLLCEIADRLESIIGREDAESFLFASGAAVGRWLAAQYDEELGGLPSDPARLAEILVDLRHRIGGDFAIDDVSGSRIRLVIGQCPYGPRGHGLTPLCAITSSIVGRIAAEGSGYAAVHLAETIAEGAMACHVIVDLDEQASDAECREYFRIGTGTDG